MVNKFVLDFVGLGFPRSGTTWLGKCLESHPDIDFAKHKETNFFLTQNSAFFKGATATYLSQMKPQSLDSYISEFENDGRIRGEFSVYYAYDREALETMKRQYPHLKAILCVRNPIDYLSSAYFFVKSSHVGYTLGDNILENIMSADMSKLFSLHRAKFAKYVRDCKDVFGDDLLIINFDDITSRPSNLLAEVFSFIDVDSEFTPSFIDKRVNKVLRPRSDTLMKVVHVLVGVIRNSPYSSVLYDWINKDSFALKAYNKIFKRSGSNIGFDSEIRAALESHLKEDIEALKSLTGFDFFKKPRDKASLKAIITTHEYANGPAQELRNYLNASKKQHVAFIASKFIRKDDRVTYLDLYENGKNILRLSSFDFKLFPNLFIYMKDLIFTFYYALMLPGKWDLYVAGDGSLTLPGFLLKKIGKVKKVVFYTIDFSPRRFKSGFLNWIYFKFDEFGVKTADEVWNVSSRISEGRRDAYGLLKKYESKQKVVPLGAWVGRIDQVKYESSLKTTAVFMGHVLKKQGIQYFMKAMPEILKRHPDFRLRIIGEGPYLMKLRDLGVKLKIENSIDYLGYVKDHAEVERLIAECALAIALYESDPESFTYYADPGKVRNYLAAGVPVLITDVPLVAREIESFNAGRIIVGNVESITVALDELLSDPSNLKNMRTNAQKLGEKNDWNLIFERLGLN